ncbi:hypothetical protein GGQ74_001138 [Desulfobaculum xiamenense]|uniref:DUF3168 domain-containing protein n=1 Tax=Desulfobaculum xiamenense TaxID=995050 RepID=A0A846QGT5_9BACT|nr:phage tail terminator-like protein [Desulfobaculum xiamenense]NJB67498.1 hypothetical protein [Desulfobaculum xiamenense]
MSVTAIRAALESRLVSLPGGWPIAWENVPFTPGGCGNHLRVHLLPATPVQAGLGTDAPNEHKGIFQVDVVVGRGDGPGEACAQVDALCVHFRRGTRCVSGVVTVTVTGVGPGPGLQEGNRYRVPVSISYRAYAAN